MCLFMAFGWYWWKAYVCTSIYSRSFWGLKLCMCTHISIYNVAVYLKMRCHKCITNARWKDHIHCNCGWSISHALVHQFSNTDFTPFLKFTGEAICCLSTLWGLHIIRQCSSTCCTIPNLIILTNKYIISLTDWVLKTYVLALLPSSPWKFWGKKIKFWK
jgi:hypothetical protein